MRVPRLASEKGLGSHERGKGELEWRRAARGNRVPPVCEVHCDSFCVNSRFMEIGFLEIGFLEINLNPIFVGKRRE